MSAFTPEQAFELRMLSAEIISKAERNGVDIDHLLARMEPNDNTLLMGLIALLVEMHGIDTMRAKFDTTITDLARG